MSAHAWGREEVGELHGLGRRDPTVRDMIGVVQQREGLNLAELAEAKPEIFGALYEEAFELVNQLGTDDGRSGL